MMKHAIPFLAVLCWLVPLAAHAATKVQEVVTPLGFRAWLVEEHSLPLVAIQLSFAGSGSAYDPKGLEGRANMVAALLMEGAGDMNSTAFNQALESRAIRLNVGVDEDSLGLILEALSESKEEAFGYMAMAATAPRFDDDAIERVRSQSLTVLKQQSQNPGYKAHRAWQQLAFGEHGYGQPAVGTPTSLPALERSDLKNFAANYLTRQNLLIAASGDITPEELSKLIDKHLGALPANYSPDKRLDEVMLPPGGGKPTIITTDIPQTIVRFGLQGLKRDDPQYFTAHVMNHILGGAGLTSKLSAEIREKRGLAYSVQTYMNPLSRGAAWMGGFSTRNEKAGEAIAALEKTLRDFTQQGVSATELADAKRYLTGSFILSLDSNTAITQFLISMQENKLGIDYFDKRNALVEAVTAEGVKAMATRLLPPGLIMVLVGKPQIAPAGQ